MQIQTAQGNFNFPNTNNLDPISHENLAVGQNIIFFSPNNQTANVFDANTIVNYWNHQGIVVTNPIPPNMTLRNPMSNLNVAPWIQGQIVTL